MKNYSTFLKLAVWSVLFYFLFEPLTLYAQEAAALVPVAIDAPAVVQPPPGFGWLASFIEWLVTIPKIGPIIVIVFKWVGAVASVATAISVAVQAILKVPELGLRWAGAKIWAYKIADFTLKIKPWMNYLSIFNVQKKR